MDTKKQNPMRGNASGLLFSILTIIAITDLSIFAMVAIVAYQYWEVIYATLSF